ncbi:hypothetical protein J4460_04825 [Candidatus Woesearchaeota archaeon]|nr:hypothetical protein [Candidatus Woesearchaeota archaeon]HIH37379.1 hypothetical protein [Candidatus Woesearchaeota archaeon]HIH48400.1 hypothetical protein [Candidatus Woesearchaeota archaeon]HIJ04219.1 hypothetical protein [Candidatus Woesearchaeota archaeon]
MIGKPEWFTYRIFGWGIRPKTKEGWFYILGFLAAVMLIVLLPIGQAIKQAGIFVLVTILILDSLLIMTHLGEHHDEREKMHQLIIERNCSFAAIAALVVAAAIQTYQNRALLSQEVLPFDWSILAVLLTMVMTKIITTLYVKKVF